MSRASWILGPLTAALMLGLAAGRSFGQVAVIIGPPTVTPISTSAYPVSTVAAPTVSYYAAPTPTVSYYAAPTPTVAYYAAPTPTVAYYAAPAVSYYAPAPVVAYSPSEVVVRRGLFGRRVVRYYYSPPAYVYP